MEVKIEELCRRVEQLEKRLEALEETMNQSVVNDDILTEQLSQIMPLELLGSECRLNALFRALDAGIIKVKDGHLEWQLHSKVLLAYFCGRVWCGDTPYYDDVDDMWVWCEGNGRFPEKALYEVFGVPSLRIMRENRLEQRAPHGRDVVDALFGKE